MSSNSESVNTLLETNPVHCKSSRERNKDGNTREDLHSANGLLNIKGVSTGVNGSLQIQTNHCSSGGKFTLEDEKKLICDLSSDVTSNTDARVPHYRASKIDETQVNENSNDGCQKVAPSDNSKEGQDITEKFMQATKSLGLGELLHDPSFGLFEAMSAIEMMDPKMDAGMMCNKGRRTVSSFEDAVERGLLKLDGFTREELIGVFDTTLCCMVTWIEGHSLAQTVFTNLYLHKPFDLNDKCMRAFSISVLKQVDLIEQCCSKAGVFEEEDFQPSTYGYNLISKIADSKSFSMMRECEDDLQKQIKLLKTSSLPESETIHSLDQINAILHRLRFMRLFHSLLVCLWKPDNLGDCNKLISSCNESLIASHKTAKLGVQRNTIGDSAEFMIGFELLVNQRLLPPTFPRATRIKSVDESYEFLGSVLQRFKTALKVTSTKGLHAIIDFFNSFSEAQPDVLSRSILQLLYGPMRFRKPTMEDMLDSMKDSVKNFIAPSVLTNRSLLSQNKEVTECVDMFFERCITHFTTYLVTCGHNRARQRDKLVLVLEDFASLQCEAERIDCYLHSLTTKIDGVRHHGNVFGTWLLYHISKLMIRYVLSGFELELYSVHEFSYIYWYLYEYLYAWLISSLSRAEALLAEAESNSKKGTKGKKLSKSKTKAYNKEILTMQAEQSLAGGYFKLMMGLLNDEKVPLPHSEFDSEEVRYCHRFSAFNNIHSPTPVRYLQFKSIKDLSSKQPGMTLYMASARSFQQAKSCVEAIPGAEKERDLSCLLKIAKTNCVVSKILASGHGSDSSNISPIEFEFNIHKHFPVIKVNLSKRRSQS